MSISKVDSPAVYMDIFSDYVPVLSTVTNLIDIFQKVVFVPFMNEKYVEKSHYYTHLKNKSFQRCFLLLFPGLGNIVIIAYDITSLKLQNDKKNAVVVKPVEAVAAV